MIRVAKDATTVLSQILTLLQGDPHRDQDFDLLEQEPQRGHDTKLQVNLSRLEVHHEQEL